MLAIALTAAVALVLLVAWIVGEAKNIRALRLPGAIAPLLIVPLAFQAGTVVGHGRAYVAARAETDAFLVTASAAVERGDSANMLKVTHWLHECSSSSDKRAGSFFFHDMADAKSQLDAPASRVVAPAAPTPNPAPESN